MIRRLQALAEGPDGARWANRPRDRMRDKLLDIFIGLLGVVLIVSMATVPLEPRGQAMLAVIGAIVFMLANRIPGKGVSVFLVMLSLSVSLRYIFWRVTETLEFGSTVELLLGAFLALAESYAVLVLVMGYIQTLWPLERKPVPLPADPDTWPTVDVYIPTYNEPMSVVRATVLGAMAIDYPPEKMRVYLLDDGRREEFRVFAEQVGCGYITRTNNKHAKAGNLNNAMQHTDGEYIAIFDCDHVPTRAFLQMTLGIPVENPRVALVQTPHHFYSPDPFQRNLAAGTRVPAEGNLFYGLLQDGNDYWNATFFCGSCAVVRRAALAEIGGFAVETVTEDAHTMLKLHRRGWDSAYLRLPLAAGLATERLALHIGQRVRWARGMLQIFRIDCPLFGPGLTIGQRICYTQAMVHFMFAIPRVTFLVAPLAIAAYAFPHIFHSVATNSRLQKNWRHSFWSEIYETVMALFLVRVTVVTMLSPRHGKFNVTAKGGLLENGFFDLRAVYPNLILAFFLIAGVLRGVITILFFHTETITFQALLLNSIWAFLALLTVMAALAVGRETRQIRMRARVRAELPALIYLPDGRITTALSRDLSQGGAAMIVERPEDVVDGAAIQVEFTVAGEALLIPARIRRWEQQFLQLSFQPVTVADEAQIVKTVFGRADAWSDWASYAPDQPMVSLWQVLVSIRGLFRPRDESTPVMRGSVGGGRTPRRRRSAVRVPAAAGARVAAGIVLALALLAGSAAPARAQLPGGQSAGPQNPVGGGSGFTVRPVPMTPTVGLPGQVPMPAQVMQGGQAPTLNFVPGPSTTTQGAALPTQTPPASGGNPGGAAARPGALPAAAFAAPAAQPAAPSSGLLPPALQPAAAGAAFPALQPNAVQPGSPFSSPGAPALTNASVQSIAPVVGAGTSRRLVLTLRQLGANGPLTLRGTSELQGVQFGIRTDEVVTAAELNLSGAMSPALIPEFSNITVALNEQYVGTIPVNRDQPRFDNLVMPISPVFFQDNNRLNFRFTGRYTVECNDPLSGLLWGTISDTATLTLTLERLPPQRDLARLPLPFFDAHEKTVLNLPVVMAAAPGNEVLQAAGIAASYFGQQADFRGAQFPVVTDAPPDGNAVLIVTSTDRPSSIALPPINGPTLAVIPNPNDAASSLLLIAGRTGSEAVAAASALALGARALGGSSATVTAPDSAERKPYDAPYWMPTDRPVRFGELVDASELQGQGYVPGTMRVPFRTAPDLYTWRKQPFPMKLRFRAPPGPIIDVAVSRLDVGINNTYLQSFPLASEPRTGWFWRLLRLVSGPPADNVDVPVYDVFAQNDLQFFFDTRPMHRGNCVAVPNDLRMSVDPDSTIDLSRAYRFTELPNLAFFVNSGFPFTRMADLSDTAVVLPDRAGTVEVSAFLNLMGRFGSLTGYPVTKLTVVRPDGVSALPDKNFLVIGTFGRVGAGAELLRGAPVRVGDGRMSVEIGNSLDSIRRLFGDNHDDVRERAATMLSANSAGENSGVLVAAESPLHAHRSVVALLASTPQGLDSLVTVMRDPDQDPNIQGDLAILSGGRVSAYRVGDSYTVGSLPFWLWPSWYLREQPLGVIGIVLLGSVLLGTSLYWALRRRAASRMNRIDA